MREPTIRQHIIQFADKSAKAAALPLVEAGREAQGPIARAGGDPSVPCRVDATGAGRRRVERAVEQAVARVSGRSPHDAGSDGAAGAARRGVTTLPPRHEAKAVLERRMSCHPRYDDWKLASPSHYDMPYVPTELELQVENLRKNVDTAAHGWPGSWHFRSGTPKLTVGGDGQVAVLEICDAEFTSMTDMRVALESLLDFVRIAERA